MDRLAVGQAAEERTAKYLEGQGYRVRERNFRSRYGEVDLVVERGETVAFVEVRMRSSATWGDPAATVTRAKQRRVVRTALHYLFAHDLRERMVRFDVVAITGGGESGRLEHLPNAFDAGM